MFVRDVVVSAIITHGDVRIRKFRLSRWFAFVVGFSGILALVLFSHASQGRHLAIGLTHLLEFGFLTRCKTET